MKSITVSFRHRLEAFRRELPLVADGRPDALHRARVASRRLRELIPIIGFDADTAREFIRRLRKVTTTLGRVRELDALAALVADRTRHADHAQACVVVGAAVSRARSVERSRLEETVPVTKLARLADALERGVDELGRDDRKTAADRKSQWAVEARVARRGSQLRSAIEDAGALYGSGRLHDVRIALKKFRYAVELLGPGRSGRESESRIAGDVRELKTVQELLGQIQDREALIKSARQVQMSTVPATSSWRELADFEHALADECRAFHGRYMGHRQRLIAILERHTVAPLSRRSIA